MLLCENSMGSAEMARPLWSPTSRAPIQLLRRRSFDQAAESARPALLGVKHCCLWPECRLTPSEIGLVSGQPRLKLSSEQAISAIGGAYLPKLHNGDLALCDVLEECAHPCMRRQSIVLSQGSAGRDRAWSPPRGDDS